MRFLLLSLSCAIMVFFAQGVFAQELVPEAPEEETDAFSVRIDIIISLSDSAEANAAFIKVVEQLNEITADCMTDQGHPSASCVQKEIQVNSQLGLFGSQVQVVFPEDAIPSAPEMP